MQDRRSSSQSRAAVAAWMVVLLLLVQQAWAAPVQSDPDGGAALAPRRVARMSPLWRLMNSKPFGAYCQNNYECSTGLCRAGQCSSSLTAEPVNY